MKLGTLYLVPNTLGEDNRDAQIHHVIPPQVVQIASQLDCWIVENAKTARSFLNAINQVCPLRKPLQEIIMKQWRGPDSDLKPIDLIQPLLHGQDMGLMSEAGLPGIADPGTEIVAIAHNLKIPVRPLTGPNSLMLALMASGMSGQHFSFHGYLPIKPPDRLKKLKAMENDSKMHQSAHLWIETPYRNSSMLSGIVTGLQPKTQVCIAIDLTLPTELIMRHNIEDWKKLLQDQTGPLPKDLDKRPAVFILQS
jgi:16S rRNA (cytidine1402-2'-O)-methyltransferase